MARLLLSLALALAVLEGAIRKWVIGSEAGSWGYLAYFSKDILFASLLLMPRQAGTRPGFELFSGAMVMGWGWNCEPELRECGIVEGGRDSDDTGGYRLRFGLSVARAFDYGRPAAGKLGVLCAFWSTVVGREIVLWDYEPNQGPLTPTLSR